MFTLIQKSCILISYKTSRLLVRISLIIFNLCLWISYFQNKHILLSVYNPAESCSYLIPINCIVDGTLKFIKGPVVMLPVVIAIPRVFPSFFTVLLMRPWPTHPGLHIHTGAMFQQQFHHVLIPRTNRINIQRPLFYIGILKHH